METLVCKTCAKQWYKNQMLYPDEGYCTNKCRSYSVYRSASTHKHKENTDISSFKGTVTKLETIKPVDKLDYTETCRRSRLTLAKDKRIERQICAQVKADRIIRKLEGK